jgi:hypothetical protein
MNRRQFVAGAVTLPIGLRATVDALAGGDPVALVTADTESRVAVVELSWQGRAVDPDAPGPAQCRERLGNDRRRLPHGARRGHLARPERADDLGLARIEGRGGRGR